MTRALALLLLLPSLAAAQVKDTATEAPVFDQKDPTSIECIAAVPESVKDPATKDDPVSAYKVVTFEDEKSVLKLAADLKYDIVSCGTPTTIASKASKVTVTTKELPGECAPVGSGCQYAPLDADGKPGKLVAAPNDLTFPAGTLSGCKIPPVRKVLVELYGKTSMPAACTTAKVEKDPKPVEEVIKAK